MNVKFKKLLSVLLCCVMLIGMIPVDTFATTENVDDSIAAEGTVTETPSGDVPVADTPVIPELPSQEEPAKEPVAEEPADNEPVDDEPAAEEPADDDQPVADPAQELYKKLMGFVTYEELRAFMDAMTAEQLEVMNLFTYEQTQALNERMKALKGVSAAPVSDEPVVEEEGTEEETADETITSEQPATEETETTEGVAEETIQEETVVSDEIQVEEKVTSDNAANAQVPAENQNGDVDALFARLMAAATYEELDAMMEAMSEEEYALMGQFSDEQNAALHARVEELSSNEAIQLEAVTLRQGETATYTQSVERNDYDFRIEKDGEYVSESASGITVTNDGNYTIKVATSENTPVGEYTIRFGTYGRWGRFNEAGTISLTVTEKIEADTPVVDQKTMTFDKTVTANANGNYDLKLTLSGAVGSKTNPAKVDIVLVIDKSGSMEGSRLRNAKNAANTLINALDTNENIDARYNIVAFSGNINSPNDHTVASSTITSGWSNSASAASSYVSRISANGGTNYEAGLLQAQTQLQNARSGATTIVVFLTDGLPTLRSSNYVDGDGWYGYGTGREENAGSVERCMQAAVAAVAKIAMNRFYVIGTGTANESNLTRLANGAALANDKAVKYTSDSNLNQTFSDIASEIATFLCENVTITDTLNHVGGTTALDRMVEVTDVDTVKVTVYKGDEIIAGPAAEVTLTATEMNKVEATLTASYNVETGVLKLAFPPEYQLEPDYTYVLSAEIAPTEKAYEEYRNGGYTESGDSNTGTHSGQFGFYSNDRAIVTYTYQGAESKEEYDHPVVQLDPGKLVINKKVVGMDVAKLSALTFDIEITYPQKDTQKKTVSFEEFTATDEEGVYTYIEDGLSPNTKYTVTESGYEVQDYEVEATVTGGDSTSGLTASGTIEKDATATVSFTNTYKLAKVNISGSKVWNDNNNQDGIRPASITVNLLANGNVVASKVVTAADNWEWTFEDVYKYDDAGKEIVYTVTEDRVEGYTPEIDGFTITNTHIPSVINIEGTKTWIDANDQDGIRPGSITVRLLANGTEVDSKTVTEDDGWEWNFADMPKYKDGVEIVYSVTEDAVPGYDVAINGYAITNTHTPETIDIEGTKTWDDAENQDGIRPGSITVNLLVEDEKVKSTTASADTNWAWSFEDLPKYKDGVEIIYSVTEDPVPGYTAEFEGYAITNTHIPETIDIEGTKTWDDANNQDGKRPGSITVRLLADGTEVESKTVTENDGWKWVFTGMPKYKDGKEITYTITEDDVADYGKKVVGYDVINTHAPETIVIEGTKAWDDADNQDGIRPGSITVNLMADGVKVDSTTASADTNWAWSFEDLPKYKDGEEIVYTVTEDDVPGYTAEFEGYAIKNTHTPETIDIEGTKTWDDANNQDGKRPDSITVRLLANGTEVDSKTVKATDGWQWTFENLPKFAGGQEIVYTVSEDPILDAAGAAVGYNASYDGYNITNKYSPEQTNITVTKAWDDNNNQDGMRPDSIKVTLLADGERIGLFGKSVTLTKENGWKGTFENLPKYKDGREIVYTVTEDVVEGYTAKIDGYNITNTHIPETIDIAGAKTWNDANNQDGIRPTSITVNLMADGVKVDSTTASADTNWAWSFEEVAKYAGGKEIVYSVTEDEVPGYTAKIDGYNITNTHTPEIIDIAGTKTWDDADNQDGIRPGSITVRLLANGTEVADVTVTGTTNWEWEFTAQPKYKDGVEIVYTVTEDPVTGYTAEINGYAIKNTHAPETIVIEGTKTWDDANNQDGKRPDSITVRLLANGTEVDSKTVKATDGWKWTFTDMPKYEDGKEIVYTVSEDPILNAAGAAVGYNASYDGYNITNKYSPEQTNITVTKAWDDNNNQDGMRPNDVTIVLVANQEETEQELVLSEANNWQGTFVNLPKYKDGNLIEYTVKEKEIENGAYTAYITGSAEKGYVVTNTHEIEKISVSGNKIWKDKNNQDGKRPEYIIVNLLADGQKVTEQRVTKNEDGEWKFTFADLDKYKEGKEIVYTVTEEALKDSAGNDLGYVVTYDDFTITNTYEPELTSVTVIKAWEDADDQDGLRPESIEVTLLADGKKVGILGKSMTLSEKNGWKGTFEDLDKYRDSGTKIVYTVVEEEVTGYESVISGDAASAFVITNVHEPEMIEKISGIKSWDDDNNRDGKRPDSITVRLMANGKEVATTTVTAENNWSYEFTNLPKYEEGVEITYVVTEDAVEGYTVAYNEENFDITNKYTPGKTSITVTKRWVDGYNHDGFRPSSVTIILYANGVEKDTLKITGKDNWIGVFDDLHLYEDGKLIEYTIEEKSVAGYNTTITGSAEQGFTVTNTHNIIPKTGDDSNLPLYTGMFGAGFSAMAVLLFLAKPRKKGKYLR